MNSAGKLLGSLEHLEQTETGPRRTRGGGYALPKRGRWINGRWYPTWRLREIASKYVSLDVDLEDEEARE